MKASDEPAFPIEAHPHGIASTGMTLRDYFAAKAMQGLISDGHTMWDNAAFQGNREEIAGFAFAMADAMLEERRKS